MDYFVKAGGAGTHGAGYDPTTDSWAQAHPTIADAITAATATLAYGDRILISHLHVETAGVSPYIIGIDDSNTPLQVISVSDTAPTTYLRGARIKGSTGASHDIRLVGEMRYYGIDFEVRDDFLYNAATEYIKFTDCKFIGEAGTLHSAANALTLIFDNCGFDFANQTSTSGLVLIGGQSHIKFIDCYSIGTGGPYSLLNNANVEGLLEMYGCDWSTWTNFSQLVEYPTNFNGSARVMLSKTKIPAGVPFVDNLVEALEGLKYTFNNVASTSAPSEYQYAQFVARGSLEATTTYYRTGSPTYPSGAQTSWKCTTTAACNVHNRANFDLFPPYMDLTAAGSDELVFHILSSVALTDDDVRVQAIYPNATNLHEPQTVSTGPADPMTAGSALSASTEAWNDEVGMNKYELSITLPSGGKSIPELLLDVGKSSALFYICPAATLR